MEYSAVVIRILVQDLLLGLMHRFQISDSLRRFSFSCSKTRFFSICTFDSLNFFRNFSPSLRRVFPTNSAWELMSMTCHFKASFADLLKACNSSFSCSNFLFSLYRLVSEALRSAICWLSRYSASLRALNSSVFSLRAASAVCCRNCSLIN
jgi:hypothetical protein